MKKWVTQLSKPSRHARTISVIGFNHCYSSIISLIKYWCTRSWAKRGHCFSSTFAFEMRTKRRSFLDSLFVLFFFRSETAIVLAKPIKRLHSVLPYVCYGRLARVRGWCNTRTCTPSSYASVPSYFGSRCACLLPWQSPRCWVTGNSNGSVACPFMSCSSLWPRSFSLLRVTSCLSCCTYNEAERHCPLGLFRQAVAASYDFRVRGRCLYCRLCFLQWTTSPLRSYSNSWPTYSIDNWTVNCSYSSLVIHVLFSVPFTQSKEASISKNVLYRR